MVCIRWRILERVQANSGGGVKFRRCWLCRPGTFVPLLFFRLLLEGSAGDPFDSHPRFARSRIRVGGRAGRDYWGARGRSGAWWN